MRFSTIVLALQFGLAISASAQNAQVSIPVYANMDIYRAGGYDDGSDGIAPASYALTARPGQVVEFTSVSGEWVCEYGNTPYSADGTVPGSNCYSPLGTILSNPVGPFSGYRTANFSGALVGMFLEDSLPASAPPPLTFIKGLPLAAGEIPTSFLALSPLIGQVFFIGDGLTGTRKGLHQAFEVPPAATHLYLAYIDSCAAPGQPGSPSCYYDNAGMLNTVFGIYSK